MNLYFKSSNFNSNAELANFIFGELNSLGFKPSTPLSEEFMFVIETYIENELVYFYMGKNDEDTKPALWQIWPEQKISFFKKVFGKNRKNVEQLAKSHLEKIINNIEGVSAVEWGI